MISPKEVFQQGGKLSPEDVATLKEQGIKGAVRIGDFSADFTSLDGESFQVVLTSAAVWLGVVTREQDYVLFVEQADRVLPDGSHPWEVPSGQVDNDSNIYATLKREVAEETGLTLTQALPIAVAVKRQQLNIPEITIVPTTDNEIWIHSEDLMKQLAREQILKGGLVFISQVGAKELMELGVRNFEPEPDGSIFFNPPPSVDTSEISRMVLEPLDTIMEGESRFIPKTSHVWAQADAFRSFMLKIHSGQ
jgi:8-oxo-dGTP pyrophosphatase MutT (NUDIX family)